MTPRIPVSKTIRIDIPSKHRPEQRHQADRRTQGTSASDRSGPPRGSAYEQLLVSIYDAVLITTTAGDITDANPRSVDFFLYGSDELSTMNIMDIISGSNEGLLSQIVDNLEDAKYTVIDARCTRKDGSMFRSEIAVSQIACGGERQLCFFIRDLTVRQQAEKALREALQRLEKHDKARSMFMSNITHELRTPLTSLMYGITNLLRGIGGPVTEKAKQYLERLDRECRRMLSTVNDILDLERLDAGSLSLAKVKVPLVRLVLRCCDSLKLHAEHKGVEMTFSFTDFSRREEFEDDESGFAFCDPPKIERTLMNIIGNAVKYTPRGGRIDVNLESDPHHDGNLLVTVADTGIGIPPHALDSVMERYYRVGETAEGSGLGLAIAREIVEKHGGHIKIQSPVPGGEQGTLVSISINSVAPPEVLVVDDEAKARRVIVAQLSSVGYNTILAPDAQEGLRHIRQERVDLLLLDLLMPGMDGIEMLRAVRSDEATPRLPVVLITAADLDDEKRKTLGDFSVPIISKPWREEDLLDAIEAAFMAENAV